jgi:hypothetical protein
VVVAYCKLLNQILPGDSEENQEHLELGLPVSGRKFEPRMSRTRSTRPRHLLNRWIENISRLTSANSCRSARQNFGGNLAQTPRPSTALIRLSAHSCCFPLAGSMQSAHVRRLSLCLMLQKRTVEVLRQAKVPATRKTHTHILHSEENRFYNECWNEYLEFYFERSSESELSHSR